MAIYADKIVDGEVIPKKRGAFVHNATGSSIAAGSLVYLSGWSETYQRFLITKADADVSGAAAAYILRDAIANGADGKAYKTHRLQGQNTNGATVSDPVYLDTTAGGWTLTAPSAANAVVQLVGRVAVVSATVGVIEFNLETSAVLPTPIIGSQLNLVVTQILGQHKVSASNAVYTKDSLYSASSVNSTAAPGTAVDFPRNVVVRLTPSTGSSGLYSGGSIVIVGSDIAGAAASEAFAVTALNTISQGIAGSVCFASIGTISHSNVTVHTASSSASNALSLHIGVGNIVALPNSASGTGAVAYAWIGTAAQPGSFTVQTGAVPVAGVSFSNALSAGSNVMIVRNLSK